MFTLRDSVVVFAFVLFLSACGGGQQSTGTGEETTSSSSTETTTTEASDEPTILEGRAVKGLVLNAQLDAYILENDSRRHVGSTQTDDQGHFSLQLSDSSGPVVIEMTPAGNGSSTMICDAVDGCDSASFGGEFSLPTDFFISSLIIPSDDTSEVSITPLTHIAAEWAQAMPGSVDEQKVELARGRTAGVFQIDSGFTFQSEPDITDPESLDGADEHAARHSLLSAAFLERAADTEDSLQEVIDGYTDILIRYAGQMDHYGDYSLYELFDAAYEIADTEDILPDIRSSLDLQIAGLSEGISAITTSFAHEQDHYDDALTTLDDVDHYLNEAGIDNSANFFADQAQQVEWIDETKIEKMVKYALEMFDGISIIAFTAGVYEGLDDAPPTLSTSIGPDGGIDVLYDFSTETMTMKGTSEDQTLDITIKLDSITGDKQVVDHEITGTITNDANTASLDGTLSFDFHDTDMEGVIMEFRDPDTDLTKVESKIKDTVSNAHLRATYNGSVSLKNNESNAQEIHVNDVSAWKEWNIPAADSSGSLVSTEISMGKLVSPNSDWISENPDTSAPAFDAQIGDTSQLSADFVTQAFSLPRMIFQAQGSIANTGTLLSSYSDKLDTFMKSDLKLEEILGMLPEIDFSLLDVRGSVDLSIEDPVEGQKVYEFTIDENRIDASQPNNTDSAFSFHLNGESGGYITAGDTLVATATLDSEDLGVRLYLADGSERGYVLGPLEDLASKEVLDAFQLILP